MTIEAALMIIGSFVSLLLMVNAYFTRQTLQQITEVRLELAKLIVKHDATEERSRFNEMELMKIREKLAKIKMGGGDFDVR